MNSKGTSGWKRSLPLPTNTRLGFFHFKGQSRRPGKMRSRPVHRVTPSRRSVVPAKAEEILALGLKLIRWLSCFAKQLRQPGDSSAQPAVTGQVASVHSIFE